MNYKDNYDIWHQNLSKTESADHVLNSPWYKTVDGLMPLSFEGKILEIGCARGDFSIYLAQKLPKATIVATDFSSFAIEDAKRKLDTLNGLSNLVFQQENAENLNFDTESFDLVFSCETLEHVSNQNNMLSEIYRVMKKEGSFILTTENYFNGMILSWFKTWIFKTPFDSGSGAQPNENFMIWFSTLKKIKNAKLKNVETQSDHFQWLLLPKVNPSKLCTKNFKKKLLNKLFKPFGRHFTYSGTK
ncbi:ubiquinone/menaquinone biosynthesis C-methylase UbiE [Pedobacter sp. UYEF25]